MIKGSPWTTVGSWLSIASLLTGLLTIYADSIPGGYTGAWVVLLLLWPGLGLLWLVLGTVALAKPVGRAGLRESWARWAAPPVLALVMAGLVLAGVPMRARFEVSRPALEGFAASVASGRPADAPRWVGLIPVERAERIPGGARFVVSGTGFIDRYGFAWSSEGGGEGCLYQLSGSWCVWEERF